MIVTPGGGMKPEYVNPLSVSGYLKEIHASCKMIRYTDYEDIQSGTALNFRSDVPDGVLTLDPEIVERFKNVMKK